MALTNSLQNTVQSIRNIFAAPNEGTAMPVEITDVKKAVIPNFLYKPPFGRPRGIDAIEVRNLAESTYVESVMDTIITECCSMDWEIRDNTKTKAPESLIDDITYFFNDPNDKKENIKTLMRPVLRDIMSYDTGIFNKVYDLTSYENLQSRLFIQAGEGYPSYEMSGTLKPLGKRTMTSLYTYDGVTFTKDPDIHGVIPEQRGYWQYYWSTAAKPIAFNRDELVWIEKRPRNYTIYGLSPIWTMKNLLYSLILGETMYYDYFTRNEIPPGMIQLLNANVEDIKRFKEQMKNFTIKKDTTLDIYRRVFHSAPVVNVEAKYVPFSISPHELEWLGQQQWFCKMVWMFFGVTPSEMGFTEDSNKSTELSQNRVVKRKAIKPYLDLLSYYITSQICPEFGFEKRVIQNRTIFVPTTQFVFTGFDVDEELEEQKLHESQLRNGQITINEWREKQRLEPVTWGDEPFKSSSGGFGGMPSEFESFINNQGEESEKNLYKGRILGRIKNNRILGDGGLECLS